MANTKKVEKVEKVEKADKVETLIIHDRNNVALYFMLFIIIIGIIALILVNWFSVQRIIDLKKEMDKDSKQTTAQKYYIVTEDIINEIEADNEIVDDTADIASLDNVEAQNTQIIIVGNSVSDNEVQNSTESRITTNRQASDSLKNR